MGGMRTSQSAGHQAKETIRAFRSELERLHRNQSLGRPRRKWSLTINVLEMDRTGPKWHQWETTTGVETLYSCAVGLISRDVLHDLAHVNLNRVFHIRLKRAKYIFTTEKVHWKFNYKLLQIFFSFYFFPVPSICSRCEILCMPRLSKSWRYMSDIEHDYVLCKYIAYTVSQP